MKNKILLGIIGMLCVVSSKAQLGVGTTSPTSMLDVRGSFATAYRAFTTNTTATVTDNLLVFTGTTASTLTIPTAVGCTGRSYMIKNASTTGPTPVLTIATTSAQTIDGAGSWSLISPNETITLISNGINWNITAQSLPGGSGTSWSQGGNSVPSIKTLGTISNFDLPFITNNTEKMRIATTGNVGIGASSFNATYPEKLLVDAGTTSSVNAIVGKGNIDSYLQLNIQNNSAGVNSSSDVVATANNGNETSNYVDMGINGGSYTGGVMGSANDGYLYTMGNNFLMGTGNVSKSLIFMTGGTSQVANERMRIDGSGNVGIGVTAPSYKLQVSAASNPLFLGGVQTGAGTDSILTIINGVVRKISTTALPGSSGWSTTGNAGTNPSSNFIGTTDAQALVIKENNTAVTRFESNSIAFGNGATVNNATNSYVLGSGANIGFSKNASMALGNNASVSNDSAFAIGTAATTTALNAFAIGNGAAANSTNSFAIGRNAYNGFSLTDGIALGNNATTNASNSIAIGSNSTAANKTQTNATSAIAIGTTAVSNSANSIAIGTNSSVGFSLSPAIAIGNSSLANGSNSIAIGNGANVGFNANATAIGAGASATVTATNSTAIGYNAAATLANEVILGDRSNNSLSVGIGTEGFSTLNREKLLVDMGTTSSVNAIVGKGSIDSYLQLNIWNNSAGINSSSDVVATANNGSETTNYVDMGINGGNYTGGVMGSANDGYLYTMGNNFLLGTGNASKSLVFMTGGTSQAANERMRIDGTGNVGIGTNAPSQKLDINGNLRLSGAFMPGNNAGSANYFLMSNGAGVAPIWIDPVGYLNSQSWILGGNTLTGTHNLGTVSNHDLPFITNNTERMRINANGNTGIGTSSFNVANPEKFVVDAGTTASVNAIVGKGSIDSYLQLNIQNNSAGTSASSDVVATANNGSETTNYVDMGINGGSYSGGVMGAANDGYLYTMGNNFLLGTGNASKSLIFMTGGTSQAANERMRIDGTGKVGIGTTSPNSTFQVSGSVTMSITTKTASYTATSTDHTIICNNTAGAITITLPAASTVTGRIYVIKKISGISNNVIIDGNVSETIDGALTRTLSVQYDTVLIQCDGSNWFVLSN
ncbi:MAG: hypothetical protein ABJA78_18470 [Ferruginibacter sp.]